MNNDIAIRSQRSELPVADRTSEAGNDRFVPPSYSDSRPPQDAVVMSGRAHDLAGKQKAAEINPVTFWDHQTRTLPVGSRRVAVDASASYKLE